MQTVTLFNPWTGIPSDIPVSEVMASVETFTSSEECEEVNLDFTGSSDRDWLNAFIAVHGISRLSAIAFS